MTDDLRNLRRLVERTPDADLLREMMLSMTARKVLANVTSMSGDNITPAMVMGIASTNRGAPQRSNALKSPTFHMFQRWNGWIELEAKP